MVEAGRKYDDIGEHGQREHQLWVNLGSVAYPASNRGCNLQRRLFHLFGKRGINYNHLIGFC